MKTLPVIRPDLATYGKIAALKQGYVAGQVEVTSKCFQMCRGCESWRDDKSGKQRGAWTIGSLSQFVRECADFPTFEHLSLTGGDPQAWEDLVPFLDWFASWRAVLQQTEGRTIKLQLNTALTQDLDKDAQRAWRAAVDDVRVSLDGATAKTYTTIRGDKKNKPEDILRRCEDLAHPRLAFNVTAMPQNVNELPQIVNVVEELTRRVPVRKMMFLAVIGPRAGDLMALEFWKGWNHFRDWLAPRTESLPFETSLGENPQEVREFLLSQEAAALPCYAGNVSFHVKCNGDLYPCCLAGGEAIETEEVLKIGNVWEHDLRWLWEKKWKAEPHYGNEAMPCSRICQWKQLQMNLAGHLAAQTTLAMP